MAVRTDDVVVNIVINEKDAIASLNRVLSTTSDLNEQAKIVGDAAVLLGEKYQIGADKVLAAFKSIRTAQEKMTAGGIQIPGSEMAPTRQVSSIASMQLHQQDVELKAQNRELAEINKKEKQRDIDNERVNVALEKGSAEIAKQQALESSRSNQLKQIVASRQQEVEAIKGVGSYNTQVVNTMRLMKDLSTQSGSNFQQVGEVLKRDFGYSTDVVSQSVVRLDNNMRGLGGTISNTLGNFKSWATTMFGIFSAMFAFQLVQLVQQFFADALAEAKKFQESVRALNLAENILSQYGIETTTKDLEDMADRLSKKFVIVPKIDVRRTEAEIARSLAILGLGGKIERVTELALLLKIKRPDKELAQIQDALTSAMFGGSTKTLEDYGVPITEQMLKTLAIKNGIAAQNEELNSQQKALAVILAVEQAIGSQQDALLETQNSIALSAERSTAAWSEFKSALGNLVAPFQAEWNMFWEESTKGATAGIEQITKAVYFLIALVKTLSDEYQKIAQANTLIFAGLPPALSGIVNQAELIKKIFTDGAAIGDNVFKKYEDYLSLIESTKKDTPTGSLVPELGDKAGTSTDDKIKKLRNSLRDLAETLDQFGDRARKAQADFDLIWKEGGRAYQDYERDVWEINQDTNQKLADSNNKSREKELEAEAKFLEKMRQLREKFLFNLEDALRERDARQVIRLTKQYAMDKTAAENEEALRRQQDAQSTANEQKKIIDDRNRRLEALAYEFNLKKQRAAEDHAAEMKQLEDELNDRLRSIANNLADELNLNADGADAIYRLFRQYFGGNGAIDKAIDYTYENIVGKTQAAFDAIMRLYNAQQKVSVSSNTPVTTTTTTTTTTSTGGTTGGVVKDRPRTGQGGAVSKNRTRGMAEGGAIIANSPTNVRFGEAGGEAMFVPLDKMSKMFQAQSPVGGSMGRGKLDVRVTLSPDLKAEIIKDSVNEVAGVLEIVQREQ